jgi:hypothetical protein
MYSLSTRWIINILSIPAIHLQYPTLSSYHPSGPFLMENTPLPIYTYRLRLIDKRVLRCWYCKVERVGNRLCSLGLHRLRFAKPV